MNPAEILEQWITEYTQRLVRLACTYTHDWAAAEDRVQDAFVKAYRAMEQLQNRDTYAWLARIVINECKMMHRRSWRETITSWLPERETSSTEDDVIAAESLERLHDAVLALPERFSVPIILYYFDNLSVDKVAEVLNERTGTIKSRLSRARDALRKRLKEDGHGERIEAGCTVARP